LKSDAKRWIKMKAAVDRETCIGCGNCEAVCPGVFMLDADGKSTVIVEVIPQEFAACAKEAEEQCPASAITVD
jgi:ferredoxin